MNRKRRAIWALSFSLILFCAAPAFAEDFPLPEETGVLEPSQGETASAPIYEHLCEKVGDLLVTEQHNAYIGGFKNGSFQPDGVITRAQAAQIFYNLLISQPQGEATFSDVPENAWYTKAVTSMAALGALKGYGDGTFRPNNSITRAEFVALAGRFCAPIEKASGFTDVTENSWARKYIDSACAYGWIRGYADGTFRPSGKITRAEAVTIVNAMLGRSADPDAVHIYYTVEFDDVSRSFWAYPQICEAATTHAYEKAGDKETWLMPNEYDGTGWETSGENTLYRDSTGQPLYGFQNISGYTYYFDMESGHLLTGWQVIGGKHYCLPDQHQSLSSPYVNNSLLTTVNYYAANRSYGDIDYITIHYTAQPNDTAEDECKYFETTYRGTSANYFVDDFGIWQCVQDKDIAWHCGNDVYYHDQCRNANSIGIEMCSLKVDSANASSPYDDDWYFSYSTESNTAALVREMMMKYGIPLENVVRHNDVSHKTCPAPYVNDFSEWQRFLTLISDGKSNYDGSYQAVVTAGEIYIRTNPGKESSPVGTLKKGSRITVLEETGKDNTSSGRWARIPGGWVSYSYICRLGE